MQTEETVRKSRHGYVPEGPERWKRARLNAEARPTSGGAKLYRKREQFAEELKQRFFAHQNQAFTVIRRQGPRPTMQFRSLHVCSVRCLGFQMQLEVGSRKDGVMVQPEDYFGLVTRALDRLGNEPVAFEWMPNPGSPWPWVRELTIATLDTSALPRPVTCRVCGTRMVGDKQTVKAIEAKTEATTQYVLVNGEFVRVEELRVVDLTERDHELLSKYSYPDARRAYVHDHGRRFDG